MVFQLAEFLEEPGHKLLFVHKPDIRTDEERIARLAAGSLIFDELIIGNTSAEFLWENFFK